MKADPDVVAARTAKSRQKNLNFQTELNQDFSAPMRIELVSVGGVRGEMGGGGDFTDRTDPAPSTGEATDDGGNCTIVGLIILGGNGDPIGAPTSADSSLYFEDGRRLLG